MVDAPVERPASEPPAQPRPEVPDEGAQRRENLRQRRNQLQPRRGRRGRRE